MKFQKLYSLRLIFYNKAADEYKTFIFKSIDYNIKIRKFIEITEILINLIRIFWSVHFQSNHFSQCRNVDIIDLEMISTLQY